MEVTSRRKKTRGASVSQSDRPTDRQSAHCFLLETEVRLSPRAAATPTLQGHFHASARRLQTDAKQPAQLSKVARIHNHSLPPPPTCSGAPRVQSSSSSSNPTLPNNQRRFHNRSKRIVNVSQQDLSSLPAFPLILQPPQHTCGCTWFVI